MLLTTLTMTTIITALATVVSSQSKESKEKWSPFECGFESMTKKRSPFSTQFFFIMLIFLIFDVEISILLPFPMGKASTEHTTEMAILVAILTLGLIIEWKSKKIEWSM